MQWAYGRGQSWDGGLHETEYTNPQGITSEQLFLDNLNKQQAAEEAYLKWKRSSQINKASKARARTQQNFEPGQAVYIWRRSTGTTRREGRGSSEGPWTGQWRGIGRVLQQQTTGDRKKPIIWVVIAGRLYRCAPEHLRLASNRERLLSEVDQPQDIPWTFEETANSINTG